MNKKKIAGTIIEGIAAVIGTTSNMVGTVCDIQEADTPNCRVAAEVSNADDAGTVLAGLQKNSENTKLNKHSMANNKVFEGQIELLEYLKTKLTTFVDQLEELKTEYEKTVDELELSGLQHDFLERFEDELDEMKTNVNKIVDDIETEDIPYIDKIIDYLENIPV
jgi:histidyl-tRNA synthetase